MTKGKGYVMGSEPAKDPVSEFSRSSFTVTGSTKVRWDDREIRESWTVALGLTILSFIGVLLFPFLIIVLTVIASIVLYLLPEFMKPKETVNTQGGWSEFPSEELKLVEEEKSLRRASDSKFSLTSLELNRAPPKLLGNLASMIRAIPSSDGFALSITLQRGDIENLLEGGNLTESIETYLKTRSKSEIETYFDYQGSLWAAKAHYFGLVKDSIDLRFHEAAIRGAVPTKGWKRCDPSQSLKRIVELRGGKSQPKYFAVGEELANWLVQLRSELASEVGTNVPGQFVVDIRSRPADLPLGVVLNPDTLQTGPTTGLSVEDISQGVLLSGGDRNGRLNLLSLVTKALIDQRKRVLVLSNRMDAIQLASLHPKGVGLILGKDLIVNPVDSESAPRNEYVPKLLRALETLADKSLTSAADLEVALGRAVAIPNSTVADVRFEPPDVDAMSDDEVLKTNIHPVKLSLWGLEGLRKLYEGSGARSFYGTQTVPMSLLSKQPLSIIVSDLGDIPLDVFAIDLLMMKLSGLEKDDELVIILDDIDGLRVSNNKYSRRALWTDSLIRDLSKVCSVMVSIDQPHMLSSGVKNELSSCISLRLRDEKDIASISSRLGLSVIGTGLHSKARWSARESSFLRTMDNDVALLVHDEIETAQPIRLNAPPVMPKLSSEDLKVRNQHVIRPVAPASDSGTKGLVAPSSDSSGNLIIKILKLIERYEPLTEEAVRRFIQTSGEDGDIEGILIQLKEASLILEGHESHSGVAYKNYRLTMKGAMAIRQADKEVAVTS